MISIVTRHRYPNMSQENTVKENSLDTLPTMKGEPLHPKGSSKAIRLLTVIAYVLSVSLAAIFLSIYYIFIWKDKTFVSASPLGLTEGSHISYNLSILEEAALDNFSFGIVGMVNNSKWHDKLPYGIQRQIMNNELIGLTTPPTTSTTTEENSTWFDDDFNIPSDDDDSSSLLNKLMPKKFSDSEND